MGKMQLKFEIITPMFMHGARPRDEAELRASSIKGLMRYWWRAVMDLPIEVLRKRETEVFGGTNPDAVKSPFILYVPPLSSTHLVKPLPHRDDRNFKLRAIPSGKEFSVTIRAQNKNVTLLAVNVLKLASLLGGFGQRARRGFGSIQYRTFKSKEEFISECSEILRYFNVRFTVQKNSIEIHRSKNARYPYLKQVLIGSPVNSAMELLEKIGKESHRNNTPLLGDVKPRYASPVWVNVKKIGNKYYPILVMVNAAPPTSIKNNASQIDGQKFKRFIENLA